MLKPAFHELAEPLWQGFSSLFAVRRDKRQFRKIRAIASRVAGEQGCARDARACASIKKSGSAAVCLRRRADIV